MACSFPPHPSTPLSACHASSCARIESEERGQGPSPAPTCTAPAVRCRCRCAVRGRCRPGGPGVSPRRAASSRPSTCGLGRCVLREGSRPERGASRPERGGGNRRRAGRGEGSWSVELGLVHGSELTFGRQRVGAGRPRPNRRRPWRTRSFGAKLRARLAREVDHAPWSCSGVNGDPDVGRLLPGQSSGRARASRADGIGRGLEPSRHSGAYGSRDVSRARTAARH